jgi:hypothetical protein
MSDPDKPAIVPDTAEDEPPSQGPNLKLIYTLIALALVVAVGVAALIVLPFYQRR